MILDELALPIVQAPMAGGPSTAALAIAVTEAGGLGFLAAGYLPTADVGQEIDSVRGRTRRPFGVNIFVPTRAPVDEGALGRYLDRLGPEAERHGVTLGDARNHDDHWEGKLALVRARRVPVVSFTFGCPEPAVTDALQAAGCSVWVTVNTPREARLAQHAGADALICQGSEAGGHRGGFDDVDDAEPLGVLALLRQVAAQTSLPLVAAGGIGDGRALAGVLSAGATAAQIGTALMRSHEAGTHPAHRELLGSSRPTALTRAFSGRTARGLVNDFLRNHDAHAPRAYPHVNRATAPIRAAARRRNDAEALNLWAGQSHRLTRDAPAATIVQGLAREARASLADGS